MQIHLYRENLLSIVIYSYINEIFFLIVLWELENVVRRTNRTKQQSNRMQYMQNIEMMYGRIVTNK